MHKRDSGEQSVLPELMLAAEKFITQAEACARGVIAIADYRELTLKISQCRACLATLQELYDRDDLTLDDPVVRGNFRSLIMMLLWVAFHGRGAIDYKHFRLVVQIFAGFSYLLVNR